MKQEFNYTGQVTKADLIEIYAKAIANLGPFNIFTEKYFSCSTKVPEDRGGTGGCTLMGYARPLFAYIAVQVMNTTGDLRTAEMQRGHPFYITPSRKICLENLADDKIKVTLEGSQRGVRRMKKVIDQVIRGDPIENARAQAIADLLKGN